MSLLNKASLIQIPSGYKDGTLYSAKPINGDGDFTFSRGSNLAATRVNSEGLIEKGRENLTLYSQDFDNASWTKVNATVTANNTTAPDGTNTADLITSTSTNETGVYYFPSVTGINTWSIYAKKGTGRYLLLNTNTPTIATKFDLQDGVIVGTPSTGAIPSIQDVGDGWYRCSITSSTSTNRFTIFITDNTTTNDFGSSIGLTLSIWGAQLEQGLVPTSYIKTTTTTEQAGILEDMPRLDYSGGASCGSLILEPQRTNLITQSEYFGAWTLNNVLITNNDTTSPEGLDNAAKWSASSGLSQKNIYQVLTCSSGVAHTTSVYFKADEYPLALIRLGGITDSPYVIYDLRDESVVSTSGLTSHTIESVANDWYRIDATATTSSTIIAPNFAFLPESGYTLTSLNIPQYTGDGTSGGYIYGAQVESSASYATSYIPTYGSSVTRGAEQYNKVITSLVPDATTFTWEVDFIVPNTAAGGGEIFGRNAAGTTQLRLYANNNGIIRFRVESGGQNYDTAVSVGDTAKCIFRCSSGVVSAFYNGVKIHTFTAVSMDFGKIQFGTPVTSPKIIRSLVFPTALTDAECIELTTI